MKRALFAELLLAGLLLGALPLPRIVLADIFTPADDCGFGLPGQGGTRQMSAICRNEEVILTYTVVYQVCELHTEKVSVGV
ncbi:MAG: hypothetical protein AB7O62_22805, partial [Pirellulales bacterium]